MNCWCIKKKKRRRRRANIRVRRERFGAAANTINRANTRNTAGLINVIVQVPIQIGSDSSNLVGSDDNAVSQGI
ncbi:hypothetical protein GCM10007416_30860 [Kroppenstedtia guangzhouensis]|jgi:hypothetical protein|uniref:Spore germination protein gerPA/gerPF n=1 Tax=Kroppenstedtia guangzhouensis TaxID=1274356 RepID=A0ABQ1H1F8_9BACL|nr:hypothetical protein [Kroppenstedtia guangzhouensis]GGA55453.1 hypothetical protein GCM10007416_30860 [Kroppenstedtia guangzhouensis]